ncbi:CDP-diacylglycerol--glycerol-3-phosphate 3-phosphatidyltransferase [Nowakowskiella sp. JEL0078]|nr:CDP-diacylglycerol--glycerol-3-phosphate 3-phosphatidyltransferase [Nowakowskiella sp. JEL0078]
MQIKSDELAQYLRSLHYTISSFSHQVSSSAITVPAIHPSSSNCLAAIDSFLEKWKRSSLINCPSDSVIVVPTVQFASLGIRQDDKVLKAVVENAGEGWEMVLSSPYLNFPKFLTEHIAAAINRGADISVITGAPEVTVRFFIDNLFNYFIPKANGFYKSKGISSLLPSAYSHLSKLFLTSVSSLTNSRSLHIKEYVPEPGWTFHAKGLWLFPGINNKDDRGVFTIGSSNLSLRSQLRDLECQLYLFVSQSDADNSLFRRTKKNLLSLQSSTKDVEEIELVNRPVGLFVKFVTWSLRKLF